jgi:hypothetical protein
MWRHDLPRKISRLFHVRFVASEQQAANNFLLIYLRLSRPYKMKWMALEFPPKKRRSRMAGY